MDITLETPEIRQALVAKVVKSLEDRNVSIKNDFDAFIDMVGEEFINESSILQVFYELDEKTCKITLVSENDNMGDVIKTMYTKFQKIQEVFPNFNHIIIPFFKDASKNQYLNYPKMICICNKEQ